VSGAQNRERLVVLLLHRGKQIGAERLHLLTDLRGLLHEVLKAHQRQRLIHTADDRAHVETGGLGAHQQRGIDRRLE